MRGAGAFVTASTVAQALVLLGVSRKPLLLGAAAWSIVRRDKGPLDHLHDAKITEGHSSASESLCGETSGQKQGLPPCSCIASSCSSRAQWRWRTLQCPPLSSPLLVVRAPARTLLRVYSSTQELRGLRVRLHLLRIRGHYCALRRVAVEWP